MYRPKHFDEGERRAIHALIRANSFGILTSITPDGLVASHLPFLLDAEKGPFGTLSAHLALANDHWKSLQGAGEVLVVFPGAHAYISPSWYVTHPSVPTWNYEAVHVYGTVRLAEDAAQTKATLRGLIETYEGTENPAWSMDLLEEAFVDRQIKGIVAIEIAITRLEGKRKLSQNRKPEDISGVIAGLRATGRPDDRATAEAMAAANPAVVVPEPA